MRSMQLHPFGFERKPQPPAIFEPAALRIHDAGEIEPAGRPPRVAAVVGAVKLHADGFEVLEPRMGLLERVAHQQLVGDPVVAGHDLARDAVDVVLGQRDDHPGVGEGGVAGAADHPGIDEGDPGPGAPWRLALSAAISPPAPAPTTSTSVSIRVPSSFAIARHQGRGRFLTEGCTSTICSGQKISQLKQVMQCSRNLITGSSLVRVQPGDFRRHRAGLHVDHVGRANGVADAAAGAALDIDFLDHAARLSPVRPRCPCR